MRNRIDIGEIERIIIGNLIERGYFKDPQTVMMAALNALQAKLAEETYTNEYDDYAYQRRMDEIQLHQEG